MTEAAGSINAKLLPSARLRARHGGFTLVELLAAIALMALMAALSWRGLDGMAQAQSRIREHADEVLALQTGLAQWRVDLDALAGTPDGGGLDWNGGTLRLTRFPAAAGEGLRVVAWTRRADAAGQWLRWQSPPVRTAGEWREAWSRAALWAQHAGAADRPLETSVAPLQAWQVLYFQNGAWAPAGPQATAQGLPEGIRLLLTLPPGHAASGALTIDWVRLTDAAGRP
jgi:general secretion pathway protein J